MASNIILKNNTHEEFKIESVDGSGAITVTSTQLKNMAEVVATTNINNIANNTIPTSDPLIAGVIWNNSGVLTISAG